jgi:hypothetical protein
MPARLHRRGDGAAFRVTEHNEEGRVQMSPRILQAAGNFPATSHFLQRE